MRKSEIIFSIVSVLVFINTGCENPPIIETAGPLFGDEESILRCCGQQINVQISGDAGIGRFYWMGLTSPFGLEKNGEAVYEQGFFNSESLSVTIDHFDNIALGEYELVIYECDEWTDLYDPKNRNIASSVGFISVPNYSPLACEDCCSPQRRWAYTQQSSLGATGASAIIRARYGKQCGSPDPSDLSYGIAYPSAVLVLQDPQSNTGTFLMWGQVGVGWEFRPVVHQNREEAFRLIYTEAFGDNGLQQDNFYDDTQEDPIDEINPPPDGTELLYQCWVEKSTGLWRFVIGQTGINVTYLQPIFKSNDITHCLWAGEIFNHEDDMPGTVNNKCIFTNMSVRNMFGNWTTIVMKEDDLVFSNNLSEWQVSRDGSTMKIWDVSPRP